MADPSTDPPDPRRLKFPQYFLLASLVLIVIGVIVFIMFQAVAGIIIAILGAVFGLGSQVSRNTRL